MVSDDDLIRRGDVLQSCAPHYQATIRAIPAADARAEGLKEAADAVDAELMRWGFPSTDGCRRDQMRTAILALIPETKP